MVWGSSKKLGTGDCLIMLCCLVRSQPLVSPKKTDKAGGVKVGCSDAREAIDDAQLLVVVRESPGSGDSHVCWLLRLVTLAMHRSC